MKRVQESPSTPSCRAVLARIIAHRNLTDDVIIAVGELVAADAYLNLWFRLAPKRNFSDEDLLGCSRFQRLR